MKLKKAWAKVARKSMKHLRTDEQRATNSPQGYIGCCAGLGEEGADDDSAIHDAFYDLYGSDPEATVGWWWGEDEYTARIVALELFALLCEEFGE